MKAPTIQPELSKNETQTIILALKLYLDPIGYLSRHPGPKEMEEINHVLTSRQMTALIRRLQKLKAGH